MPAGTLKMTHGDFKVGEPAPRAGTYACVGCARAGRPPSRCEVAVNGVFPFCPACKELGVEEMDMLWRIAA